jgi:hypothetical protein
MTTMCNLYNYAEDKGIRIRANRQQYNSWYAFMRKYASNVQKYLQDMYIRDIDDTGRNQIRQNVCVGCR